MSRSEPRIVILGRGRVGRGLAAALRGGRGRARGGGGSERDGARPAVSLRAGSAARPRVEDADIVVLAVPDDAIAAVAERVAPRLSPGAVVLHCAGARGPAELDACRARGASVGVMHPLVSFALPQSPPSLAGATFVVGGGTAAVAAARLLARAAGARCVVAPIHGPAYHAAAALVANGAAALATAAVGVLVTLGLRRRAAERACGGLLRSVADNVERVGVPRALSGPVRRGDAETVRRHRAALSALSAQGLEAYDAIAWQILRTAKAAGLDARRHRALRRALEEDT